MNIQEVKNDYSMKYRYKKKYKERIGKIVWKGVR